MTPIKISLCAVPYEVTFQDGQVIFEEKSGFPTFSRFAFEWTGCGWYLVDHESTFDKLFIPHIVAAYEWTKDNFAIKWNNGVGIATLGKS